MTLPLSICGRTFTAEDLAAIRNIIRKDNINRTEISREVCRRLNWLKPDGELKDMSCRVALLRLHRSGMIELPPPRSKNGKGGCRIKCTTAGNAGHPITGDLSGLGNVQLIRVTGRMQSRFWNELIQRYHYLGYTPLPGAQIRYLIYSESGMLLGAIGFSAAAWALRPRDEFIGWNKEQRINRLRLVTNNSKGF